MLKHLYFSKTVAQMRWYFNYRMNMIQFVMLNEYDNPDIII